jgi:translation initiation factor 1 (eIF-1/SUI1)
MSKDRIRRTNRINKTGGITLDSSEILALPIAIATGHEAGPPSDDADDAADKAPLKPDGSRCATPPPPDFSDFLKTAERATLHRESSGRGGRTVTALSLKPNPDAKLAGEIAKAMRRGLGCGAHVEDPKIILQGDIKERAEQWLLRRGVKWVVMGN